MKILITGAAGFLGSHLSEKYVLDKHLVYGLDNLMNGNLNNIRTLLHKKNFKFIRGDITLNEIYSKLPNDFDAIIHLAAQIHVDRSIVNPEETFKSPPPKMNPSAAVFPTPGEIVSKMQAEVLRKERFVSVEAVDSWGFDWNMLENSAVSFGDPHRISSASPLQIGDP